MENMILIAPNRSYVRQAAEYRREFLDAGDSMDGTGSLRQAENAGQWLDSLEPLSRRETTPPHLVPATQLVFVREADDRLVGMIQIRHCLNDYLAKFGGHIGYSVRPSERRKGYAGAMLAAALPVCRELGLERVLITCSEDNEASRRTILSNGGVYESTVLEPGDAAGTERYWIELRGD